MPGKQNVYEPYGLTRAYFQEKISKLNATLQSRRSSRLCSVANLPQEIKGWAARRTQIEMVHMVLYANRVKLDETLDQTERAALLQTLNSQRLDCQDTLLALNINSSNDCPDFLEDLLMDLNIFYEMKRVLISMRKSPQSMITEISAHIPDEIFESLISCYSIVEEREAFIRDLASHYPAAAKICNQLIYIKQNQEEVFQNLCDSIDRSIQQLIADEQEYIQVRLASNSALTDEQRTELTVSLTHRRVQHSGEAAKQASKSSRKRVSFFDGPPTTKIFEQTELSEANARKLTLSADL
jgi:hypothetical protein